MRQLVDEICDVVHHVFAHSSLSRCAVRRRQFCRRSLRNSFGVFGCSVHMLGDAARRCRLSLGLALLDAKSPGAHSLSQALVLGPRRVGIFHRAKAHRPCALRVPALGERAPAVDQVVDCATSEIRSEEGFLDVGHDFMRKWSGLVVLMIIRILVENPCRQGFVPWGTPPASWARPRCQPQWMWLQGPPGRLAWGRPAQQRGCRSLGVPGSQVPGPRVPPGIPEGGRMGPM
jgi:hypothetical protein